MTLSRNDIALAGVAAGLLTALALAVANSAGDGDNGGAPEFAVSLAVCLAVAAALFGRAIPRAGRPGRAGLVTGLLGALSLAAFWSGLPFVLGPAAVAFGLRGGARQDGRPASRAAVALGALVVVAGLAAVAIDGAQ